MSEVNFLLTLSADFEAAHHYADVPADKPAGRVHGHNYRVDADFTASRMDARGFVFDSATFEELVGALDHSDLNARLGKHLDGNPTAENVAWFLWNQLQEIILENRDQTRVFVSRVRVTENARVCAEVRATRDRT